MSAIREDDDVVFPINERETGKKVRSSKHIPPVGEESVTPCFHQGIGVTGSYEYHTVVVHLNILQEKTHYKNLTPISGTFMEKKGSYMHIKQETGNSNGNITGIQENVTHQNLSKCAISIFLC